MADPQIPVALEDTPIPIHTQKQSVDPWNVSGEVNADGTVQAINYQKLTEEFGTKLIDEKLLARFEKVTGHKPHRFLRRGIVFSHRDLDLYVLLSLPTHVCCRFPDPDLGCWTVTRGASRSSSTPDAVRRRTVFSGFLTCLYCDCCLTPCSLGHTTPFLFTKWLQDVFDVPLVIMLTDDEKVRTRTASPALPLPRRAELEVVLLLGESNHRGSDGVCPHEVSGFAPGCSWPCAADREFCSSKDIVSLLANGQIGAS